MSNQLRNIVIALVLAAGVASATAQTGPPVAPGSPDSPESTTRPNKAVSPSARLELTSAQKSAIFNAVRQDTAKIAPPPRFEASIGAPIPPSTELQILPERALAEVPQAKSVQYTVVQNQVVLVDPTTMRVVDIIGQ